MRLLNRLAVLLKADVHGVVESLEERSLLLKQYLREAEIELDRNRARLEAMSDEAKALGEAVERERATMARLDEDVDLALAGEKDDLARFAIRNLLTHRRELERMLHQKEQCEDRIDALRGRVDQQSEQYESLKSRARAELRRETVADAESWCDPTSVAAEEVEIELMRRRTTGGAGS